MADPFFDAAPRTFPGDPNPPPKAPDAPPAPKTSTAPTTSAGSGALPPSAAGGASPASPAAPSEDKTFSVVEGADGTRDGYALDKNGPTHVASIDNPDADKILHAVGSYDEKTKTWNNIPPDVFKSLTEGRLSFPQQLWNAVKDGERGVVGALNASRFVDGEMSREQLTERNQPELLKAQLGADGHPAAAWEGLGAMAADAAKHPIDATMKAVRSALRTTASAVPALAEVLKGAAKGSAEVGGAALAASAATGTLELPPVAAGVTAAFLAVGPVYGAFKALYNLEKGGIAQEMAQHPEFDDKTIKEAAILGGTAKAALWMLSSEFMPAAKYAATLTGLAESKVIPSAIANIMGSSAVLGGITGAQEKIRQLFINMAAESTKNPKLLIPGDQGHALVMKAMLGGFGMGAVLGAAGALVSKTEAGNPTSVADKNVADQDAKPAAYNTPENPLELGPRGKENVAANAALDQKPVETPANKFVLDRPLAFGPKGNDKQTAADIREQFSGVKNEQIVRGTQLAQEIKRAVPDENMRQGMFWYKAANGDIHGLEDALTDPDLAKYHDQIKAALNLSPEALEALKKVDQYYKESGEVSEKIGTIRNVLENYQNRIYVPEKPTDFVKNEMSSGIKQTTSHAKQRVYETEFDAAAAGKTFATTDVADALSIHNEEMARVNTSRKMADAMAESGLGAWKQKDNIPSGWKQVGSLEKDVPIRGADGKAVVGEDGNQLHSRSSFVAPEGIAKGLEAIADPNFVKKVDTLRGIQRYQGLVKTVDLSFSFFHHLSMLAQTIYQRDGSTLMDLPTMSKVLATPEFAANEQDFALHGGMTAAVEGNQDILRHLTQNNGDFFSKVVNAPGIKQGLELTDRNAEFLFGKMQRLMKVNSYGARVADWVADHPDASNSEVLAAKQGFAKHVNAVYGGLNWEAMGMTKSNLSLMRLVLLAPDWTVSNLQLLGQALGGGTAGTATRAHIASAALMGIVGTEALNKVMTGHFTDQNPSGHKLEVEISPGVYSSMFRGGIGDMVKFASMVSESGKKDALSRFTQGKASPIIRVGTAVLTQREYNGKPIVGTYGMIKYLLEAGTPVPLGLSNAASYVENERATPVGTAAVASGAARYSKVKK